MIETVDLTSLATYLVRDGLLNIKTAKEASRLSREQGFSFTYYLVKNKLLSSESIFNYCQKHFNVPLFNLQNYQSENNASALLNHELVCKYRVLPIALHSQYMEIAIVDPSDHITLKAIEFHIGLAIKPFLIAEQCLEEILQQYYKPKHLKANLHATLSKINDTEETSFFIDSADEDEEPIRDFLNKLLQDAIENNVSDIHLEPHKNDYRIRFRLDGFLYEATVIPNHLAQRLLTRLKILANLNITEQRLPQDGSIRLKTKLDLRISTCRTLFGEKIVLRILQNQFAVNSMDSLGMTVEQQKLFLTTLNHPQGLILVTGPTGSGKTVTLYTALHFLNSIEKNIQTVEDPVEIELAGINQVNIDPKIGMDFPIILRAFLRQDPDVIMIGEIRDQETANIAIQAAQTGHLVLSTLHTNSAIETLTRLKSLGVNTHQLIYSISLIISQRLMRLLCDHCKQLDATTSYYLPIGCKHCRQGYHGRTGIFECVPINEEFSRFILADHKINPAQALWVEGMKKVQAGLTSYAELIRVLGKP